MRFYEGEDEAKIGPSLIKLHVFSELYITYWIVYYLLNQVIHQSRLKRSGLVSDVKCKML